MAMPHRRTADDLHDGKANYMRNTKRWTIGGTALVSLLGMSVLNGPIASADSSASIEGVKVSFKSYGEVFTLDDTKCDANPVYLLYSVDGGQIHRYDFSGGCNADPAVINLSFAENKVIRYRGMRECGCVPRLLHRRDDRPDLTACRGHWFLQ